MSSSPPRTYTTPPQERFALLDISRAIAALAVVVFHWQHFSFAPYTLPAGFDYRAEPFSGLLLPLYRYGAMAVDYFFILSGFIFFRKYQHAIHDREVRGREFFILRLSRLYPLHFLTLFIVAGLQWLYFSRHGHYWVNAFNDSYHFLLQLFFASQWELQRGPSFNDVTWSLSIEVLLYALFYFLARRWRLRWFVLAAFSLLGFGLMSVGIAALGRGLFGFFVGGLISRGLPSDKVGAGKTAAVYAWLFLALAVNLLFFCTPLFSHCVAALTQGAIRLVPHWAAAAGKLQERIARIGQYVLVVALLFPALVSSLILFERRFHSAFRRFDFLGNLSYSTYLWHFPLMLSLALLSPAAYLLPDSALAGEIFIGFFPVLILLSFASYYGIEAPMQRVMRRLLLGRNRSVRLARTGETRLAHSSVDVP